MAAPHNVREHSILREVIELCKGRAALLHHAHAMMASAIEHAAEYAFEHFAEHFVEHSVEHAIEHRLFSHSASPHHASNTRCHLGTRRAMFMLGSNLSSESIKKKSIFDTWVPISIIRARR